MQISFFVMLATPALETRFNSLEISVKSFLVWVATVIVPAAEEIMAGREVEASRKKSALRTMQFMKSENPAFCKLEIQRVLQVFRASLTVYTYAVKHGRIRELLFHSSCDWNFSVTPLNSRRFLQLVIQQQADQGAFTALLERLNSVQGTSLFSCGSLDEPRSFE